MLLLNATLTVRGRQAASHQGKGWETFTDEVIRAVSDKPERVVFILWGASARKKRALVDTTRHEVIESAHPSPLSAHNGFLGSRPFSRANEALVAAGRAPVDWRIPPLLTATPAASVCAHNRMPVLSAQRTSQRRSVGSRAMRAVVLQGDRDVSVEDVPDAGVPGPDGLLLRVDRTAICGSDLHLYHGPMTIPGVHLGHEFVGTVEDVGSAVTTVGKGDRVLVSGVIGCGVCPACRAGDVVVCRNAGTKVFGTSLELPGGQAEAVAVPAADSSVMQIPEGISDEQAVLLTDILPTGYLGAQRADITPGDTVVVIGLGPVGVFALQCAQLYGPSRILAVDMVPDRLARAEQLGAEPIDATGGDAVAKVYEATGGPGRRSGDRSGGRRPDRQRRHPLRRPGRHHLGGRREPQLRVPVPGAGGAHEATHLPGDAGLDPDHVAGPVPPRGHCQAAPRGRLHPPPRAVRRGRGVSHLGPGEDGVLKVLLDPTG